MVRLGRTLGRCSDLATGFLPVVTVAMHTGEDGTGPQLAPVIGAPVLPQSASIETFEAFLQAAGISY